MIKKQSYTAPTVSIISVNLHGILQSVSNEIKVYADIETDSQDEQYSRIQHDIWDEE